MVHLVYNYGKNKYRNNYLKRLHKKTAIFKVFFFILEEKPEIYNLKYIRSGLKPYETYFETDDLLLYYIFKGLNDILNQMFDHRVGLKFIVILLFFFF